MTVLDLLLVLTVATTAALGSQRRLTGLLVGLGGAVALRPLLVLADLNPGLALIGALLVGLGLAFIGRHLLQLAQVPGLAARVAGGVGGGLLGLAVVLTLVTSMPIERNPLSPSELVYPPRDSLPNGVRQVVHGSSLVAVGREVLFAPLLPAGSLPQERASLVDALHRWVIVGEPWRRPS